MRDIFGTHDGETFSAGLIYVESEAAFDVNLDLVCISDGKHLSQVLLMWTCPRFSQMVCGKPSLVLYDCSCLSTCSSRSPPEKLTRQPKTKVLVKWTDFTKSSGPGSLRNYTNLWIFSQQKLKRQFMHRLYTSYWDGRWCDFRTTLRIGTEKAGIVYFLCATFGSTAVLGFDDCTALLANE